MCSILFKAQRGEFFNNGLRKRAYHENDPLDKNFDYAYYIENVTPAHFLN